MLIDALTASVILSIFVVGIGAFWVTGDRRANALVTQEKALMVANGEMGRLVSLYAYTSFGTTGPATTTGYDGPTSLPTTRLTYPSSLTGYVSGPADDFTTTSAATFQSGPDPVVWVGSSLSASLNRSYVWVDQSQNEMGRLSWTVTNITPAPCTVSGGCACLSFAGVAGGVCQQITVYLEYPYRLVAGAAVADSSTIQVITLASVVGRHT